MVPLIRRLALAALVAAPLAAAAANLGKLTVLSKTGEPLNAEIDIVAIRADERDSLAASLAPAEAFGAINVTPSPPPGVVQTAVERRADGRYVLRLTSTEPINQPLVDLLLELSWKGGRAVRHYTFLISPPETAPVLAVTPAPEPAPSVAPESVPRESVARELPKAKAAPPAAGPRAPRSSTHTVQPGETLGRIAQASRRAGVTVEQMIVAIFRANPDAFIGSNLNRVRAGSVLTIPSAEEATAIALDEARRVIAESRAGFEEYRRRLASSVATGAPRPAGSRETTLAVAKPAPPAARGDQLTVRGDDTGDDLAARDRALAAARERIQKLERAIEQLRQLLEARDREVEGKLEPKAR